jgi:hypothetical protein
VNGITIEERGASYRVLRTLPSGTIVTLGIFPTAAAAVADATDQVLALEETS